MLVVALPVLIPMATVVLALLLRRNPKAVTAVATLGTIGLLAVGISMLTSTATGGMMVLHVGGWDAPIGIPLVIDRLSASLVTITAIIALAVIGYRQWVEQDDDPTWHILIQSLLIGVGGAFTTGDFFNLYVWFEVMLLSSFALLGRGEARNQTEGAVKYVVLNLVGSAVFLTGLGVLYGSLGTLAMADVAARLADGYGGGAAQAAVGLLLTAFVIKAGLFPVFQWLPSSYHTAPAAVAALFAGLLTKVGVYALARMLSLVGTPGDTMHTVLLTLGSITMVVGVFGAAVQTNLPRILAFHIVSQVGYIVVGLALGTAAAMTAAVFYLLHHIVVKANLFLVGGMVTGPSGEVDVRQLGGMAKRAPLLAVMFAIPALSLAGLPPLSGFVAKFGLIQAGVAEHSWTMVSMAVLAGLLTIFSMLKIWVEVFWKPAVDERTTELNLGKRAYLPSAMLGVITVAIGLGAGPMVNWCMGTADQIRDRDGYIAAVLTPPPADTAAVATTTGDAP